MLLGLVLSVCKFVQSQTVGNEVGDVVKFTTAVPSEHKRDAESNYLNPGRVQENLNN